MWLILQLFVTIGPKMWVKRSQVFLPESTWVGGQTQLVSTKCTLVMGMGGLEWGHFEQNVPMEAFLGLFGSK